VLPPRGLRSCLRWIADVPRANSVVAPASLLSSTDGGREWGRGADRGRSLDSGYATIGYLDTTRAQFVVHYHEERAHQGIGNERIERRASVGDGEVVCDERLGGLLKCYRRAA
jgi:hypothetical protein